LWADCSPKESLLTTPFHVLALLVAEPPFAAPTSPPAPRADAGQPTIGAVQSRHLGAVPHAANSKLGRGGDGAPTR
jgi:hypothetical protein